MESSGNKKEDLHPESLSIGEDQYDDSHATSVHSPVSVGEKGRLEAYVPVPPTLDDVSILTTKLTPPEMKDTTTSRSWTSEEDAELTRLVNLYGYKWQKIAENFNNNGQFPSYRNSDLCRQRWSFQLDPDIQNGPWTEAEDEALVEAHAALGRQWAQIAKTIEGRTDKAVRNRWKSLDFKARLSTKSVDVGKLTLPKKMLAPRGWSAEEDAELTRRFNLYGKDWQKIAADFNKDGQLPSNRNFNQCRDRWSKHLDPNIRKEPWTEAEDVALSEAHAVLGSKWAQISKTIDGRTGLAVRHRWNSVNFQSKMNFKEHHGHQKTRAPSTSADSDNRSTYPEKKRKFIKTDDTTGMNL